MSLEIKIGVKKEGYKNPITKSVAIVYPDNLSVLDYIKIRIKHPIKLSPEKTENEHQKMVKDEAEDLWGPLEE